MKAERRAERDDRGLQDVTPGEGESRPQPCVGPTNSRDGHAECERKGRAADLRHEPSERDGDRGDNGRGEEAWHEIHGRILNVRGSPAETPG